jgi:hypothetical protein
VQISGLVGNPISSHTDPSNGHGHLATQILSGRAQEKSNGASATEADSEHAVDAGNGGPGSRPAEQLVRRPHNSGHRREARQTNQKSDATANGVPVAGTSQPVQFLAILGDVQDVQAGVAKAQATSSQVLSQLPGATVGADHAAPVSSSDGKAAPATAEANPTNSGNQPGDTGAPNPAQQTLARTMDAFLEANQAAVNQPQGSATPPSEVAFAARVAIKTDPRVTAPDEGQAAIAASRFEGMALRNQAAATPRAAQPATESSVPEQEQAAAVAASPFNAMASDGGSGESQGHAEPDTANARVNLAPAQPAGINQNGNAAQTLASAAQPAEEAPSAAQTATSPASAVQAATGRTQQSNSGAMSVKAAAAGPAGSSAPAGPQNASSSVVAPGPASVDATTGRSSTTAKTAPQEHTAQDVQAQNEPADRASQAVRDISLNLSTKDQTVQVRLSERAGELHVTVRTPDATLTHGMREGLSDLVGRLEHGGYRAETWQPGGDSRDRGQESSRRGFSQQQNAGGKGSGRQQNSHDPESESETPKWIGELESSFHKE